MKRELVLGVLSLSVIAAAGCSNSGSAADATTEAATTAAEATVAVRTVKTAGVKITKADDITAETQSDDQSGSGMLLLGDSSAGVSKNEKFYSADIGLSQEQFEADGFVLGDSCDVVFSNGYTIEDVPYYNGYYVNYGSPVIVAYPGAASICITYNNQGIWDQAGLSDGDTVTISLNEAGKYSAIQEALGQQYSTDITKYDSEKEFCNFRALAGGKLKADFFYRGASPVDNSRCRAAHTDAILESVGIKFVVDLADSVSDMENYMAAADFNSPYTAALYDNGQVVLLDMGSAYQSEDYMKKVAEGFNAMTASDGPVYIHCMEGKDRTGFVCTLLEALAGASYDEMKKDYMETYNNYYSVSAEGTPEKYEAIADLYFDAFVSFLHGTEDKDVLVSADYTDDAVNYLKNGGMTDEEIENLIAFITE